MRFCGVYSFTKKWDIKMWSPVGCIFVHTGARHKDLEPSEVNMRPRRGWSIRIWSFCAVYLFTERWGIKIWSPVGCRFVHTREGTKDLEECVCSLAEGWGIRI